MAILQKLSLQSLMERTHRSGAEGAVVRWTTLAKRGAPTEPAGETASSNLVASMMARQPMDIRKRIERQEKKILKLTAELEAAKDEYDNLLEEKKETDKKKLFEAYAKSKRSLEEVIDFMKGKADL